MSDGTPQVTPVWVDFDGQHIVITAHPDRVKSRNILARPHVAIDIVDPDNALRYVAVRGRVQEVSNEQVWPYMDSLARRYLGMDTYPSRGLGEIRCIFQIDLEHVIAESSEVPDVAT